MASQIIFGLFILTLVSPLPLSEAVTFKLTNVVCESYNKSWVVVNSCRLKAIKRDVAVFNFNGTILYPANDIVTHVEIFKRANGYKPWLFNFDVDICRFYRQSYSPIAALIFNLTREFTNVNHTCPYVGPVLIKGFYPKAELLRLPYPTGNYLLASRWYYNKKMQFDLNLSYVFVENLLDQ